MVIRWYNGFIQSPKTTDVGPNGRYELVDETGLYNKLNNTYLITNKNKNETLHCLVRFITKMTKDGVKKVTEQYVVNFIGI